MIARLLLLPLLSLAADVPTDSHWKFLNWYPNHHVVPQLEPGQEVRIDGNLDDDAWASTEWLDSSFADITQHADEFLNAVPPNLQARVKLRWDARFLYIGAELREPFIDATIAGHNGPNPPYLDNDFEVFIDPSGTTQYYMEYEMNAGNATYDIKWGVPDGAGLGSAPFSDPDWAVFPTAVNTTFPGYAGNWTMKADVDGLAAGGMTTATSYAADDFQTFRYPSARWSLEIAFPIQSSPTHGGLLDADPVRQAEYDAYHPLNGDAGPGRPRYWWADFARAEHTRQYNVSGATPVLCPFNCSAALEDAEWSGPPEEWVFDADAAQTQWPTYLGGLFTSWDNYWEWVWQPVGVANPGVGYMHRPSSWGLLQFAPPEGAPLCRNIEFPGRHLAMSVHIAQRAHADAHNGSFATELATLIDDAYCNLQLTTSDTCDIAALRYAAANPAIFQVTIVVEEMASALSRECTARPCFTALVNVTVPEGGGAYTAKVNEDRWLRVEHGEQVKESPCL